MQKLTPLFQLTFQTKIPFTLKSYKNTSGMSWLSPIGRVSYWALRMVTIWAVPASVAPIITLAVSVQSELENNSPFGFDPEFAESKSCLPPSLPLPTEFALSGVALVGTWFGGLWCGVDCWLVSLRKLSSELHSSSPPIFWRRERLNLVRRGVASDTGEEGEAGPLLGAGEQLGDSGNMAGQVGVL